MAQRTYDGTLKFTTSRTEAQTARRGKFSITGETVSTTDIDTSTVLNDWESVNDKAVTATRDKIAIDFGIAADFDLLGKVVADLQEDTGVSADNIVGTLHYINDYTGFSGVTEEQEGNYLAFMVNYTGNYTSLTVQGGSSSEVTLDNDRTMVLRIVKQKPIVVRAYNGDVCVASKAYKIDQLKLESAETNTESGGDSV